VENDPDANLNARENLEHNGVTDRVEIVEAMADAALLAELGTFDLILANILSGVIRPLLPAFHAALGASPEGRLIVSGILRSEHRQVVERRAHAGLPLSWGSDEEEEWWSALLFADGLTRGAGRPRGVRGPRPGTTITMWRPAMAEKTIFSRIIDGEIPGDFVYQDEHLVAIRDINPAAPVHVLVIPRKPSRRSTQLTPRTTRSPGTCC
jgi:hypothetical protein